MNSSQVGETTRGVRRDNFSSCKHLVSLTRDEQLKQKMRAYAMTRMFTDVFFLPSAENWKLQVAWRADGASQKLIAPLWKNGSLLDHGKRNKIDFVGPSRAKRPIRIYLQTILQRFYASTILTQTPHCNSWTLAITWFFTFLSLSRIHFGLYDASNSQMDFSVYPEAL